MKYLQRLIGLLIISAAIFSCQKEFSVETPVGGTNASAQWEFKEGGVLFKGPIDTASVDTLNGYTFLTMIGRSADGSAQMTLQVFGKDLKPGTYKTPFSLFAYIKGGTQVYQTDQTATDSFTIVITKADSTGISGTFSGKASGKAIVDGRFSAPLKTSAPVTPTTKDSGQVVLWSKAGCGGDTSTKPITVSVSGKSGQITKFGTEPATCDPPGTYFLKLPVGTYQYVAKCASDSVTGSFTVTKGSCTKAQVNFSATPVPTGDYFPMTGGFNWTYLYEASSPDDTLYTFSLGNTAVFGGKTYNRFTNTDGQNKDSSYYRKSGSSYYEYVFASSEKDSSSGVTISFPAYEYTFLIDNLTANQTFTNTYTGTATSPSLPVPASITASDKTTILVTGATVTVSGKTYTNVIKTKTIYSFTAGGTTTDIYGVEQWFSKGIGLIKYIDYQSPPFTTPTYIKNITRYKVI